MASRCDAPTFEKASLSSPNNSLLPKNTEDKNRYPGGLKLLLKTFKK